MKICKTIFFGVAFMILNLVGPNNAQAEQATIQPQGQTTEVMFIHGMFMTPLCWDQWQQKFSEAGFQTSAPAWPLHESVEAMRDPAHQPELGELTLDQVLDHYRQILRSKTIKPILIGHSMGGLIAQILLSEGLASKAIAIDSAPPKGIVVFSLPFLRSNFGAINPLAPSSKPIAMNLKQFSYAFANQQTAEAQSELYSKFYVPESRRIARSGLTSAAAIDFSRPRGPLLLIAGGSDHIIPPNLNHANYLAYSRTPGRTDFEQFEGRDHSTILSPGWSDVADRVLSWIEAE